MFERLRSNRLYLVIGPLALSAPLASFLRFYDIPLLSPEAFFSYAILVLIGLVAGLVMALGGNLIQALISSGIIILIVFSELERSLLYSQGLRYRYFLLLCVFLLGIFLYFLRADRARFLVIVFGVMCLVGITSGTPHITEVSEKSHHQPDTSLPPYIHIVLDEHIGIEGIPPSSDKKNKFSLELKKKYIDQGFLVFGRAYSRFFNTEMSFSSFLNFQNFQSTDNFSANLIPVGKSEQKSILNQIVPITFKPNALFEALSRRGYIINTFHPAPYSYCNEKVIYRFGKCVAYPSTGLKFFKSESIILTALMKKMRLLQAYNKMVAVLGGPEITIDNSSAPIQTYASANKFAEFLGEGKPGNAYFIHLLLPHSSYILDEKCSHDKNWNFFKKEALHKTYTRYIKQIQCTHVVVDKIIDKLNANTEARHGTIVIHGDHGSRIGLLKKPPVGKSAGLFSGEEYIQYFSTFFSIRSPSLAPGYDRRPFALDELLKVSILGKTDFLKDEQGKFVYSPSSDSSFKQFTLPPFANGSKVKAW